MKPATLTLKDGRTITYDIYGDPKGQPVIFSHGLSDSRLIRNPDDSIATKLGLRIIAADQPGVGGSTPLPHRRMVDWGKDMEELADHLGLKNFAVAGHSGGAPHALAIAYRLPKRVTKIVLASPVAPFDEPHIAKQLVNKDLKLMTKLHHLAFVIKSGSNMAAKKALKDISAFMAKTAKDDRSDSDTFLKDPAQRAMFAASFTAGMEQGGEGMYEMTMALWDWGFKLTDIKQHVELFYGDNDDILDPAMPRHVAEELPNCTAHIWPGAGHYGFVDRERWQEFLGALV